MVKEKHKETRKEEMVVCPLGRFFLDLEGITGERSRFFEHLNQSRIEFLKALRSLVDDRIESLEKKGSRSGKKKATKIQVE